MVNGEIQVGSGKLQAAALAVRSGLVSLGDSGKNTPGELEITGANAGFYAGTALVVNSNLCQVSLPRTNSTLAFYPGSTLDLRGGSLIVATGRLLLHGTLRIGCAMAGEPSLLHYVGVDEGEGRALLGSDFNIEPGGDFQDGCLANPEDVVENAVIIDAVVGLVKDKNGKVWTKIVDTPAGRFEFAAKLGVAVDEGGGLRVRYLG